MKTVTKQEYVCEICGHHYAKKETAEKCESRKVTQDKGVNVGDTILITRGEGTGEKAVVTNVSVFYMEWGHYVAERYWHTVCITAEVRSGGTRVLAFDSYETI